MEPSRPGVSPGAPPSQGGSKAARPGGGPTKGELERDLGKVDGRKWVRRLVILLSIAAVIAGVGFWRVKTRPPPPPKFVIGAVSKGDIFETVQSTGQIQPLTQVQVGAQVSGRITKVFVDYNSVVKEGDVLAEIDPTLFSAAIDQNQAGLAAAQAQVAHAASAVQTAKQLLDRAQQLYSEGLGSQTNLDQAKGSYDVAVADLAAARANISQNVAVLKSAKTNMEYTRIFSPIAGVVITRSIDPGQTVAASFQAPVLFVIAQDLHQMRVLADVDEADVGKLKEGMMAEVSVDAFPGEKFKGLVSQVRYSPNSNSGVVTYSAVIDVANPDIKLRPGMTATVSIRTGEALAANKIPNAALRYKPAPPVDKDGKKIPQDPLPPLGPHKGRIYVVTDEKPGAEKAEMREVDIGITDGINTVLVTDLGGAKLVVDENDDPNKKAGRAF